MKKSALFISALALTAALTASLVGCQAQKSPEQLIKEDLSAQFDEVKKADSAAWSEEFGMDDADFADLGIDSGTFMAGYLDGFDYEINEVIVDKDKGTATAKVDVTCKKFDEIFAAWFGDYMGKAMSMLNAPEEEITKLAGETLMNTVNNTAAKTTSCELTYKKDSDGKWAADEKIFEAEIYRAMGLESLMNDSATPANAA